MANIDYTTPGFYNWTVPVGVAYITGTCIGAGGAGFTIFPFSDSLIGGGGGGGGFCRANAFVNAGDVLTIQVGAGGTTNPFAGIYTNPGGSTQINGNGFFIAGGGGGAGVTPAVNTISTGGGAAASGSPIFGGVVAFPGGFGDAASLGGEGGSSGTQFGTQNRCGPGAGGDGGAIGGAGVNLDGNSTGCPPLVFTREGFSGKAYGGGGCGQRGAFGDGFGAQGAARITFQYENPVINSFSKNPTANLTVGQSVNLSWATTYADNVSITNIGSVSPGGNTNVTPPSTTTYTLTARLNATGVQVQQSLTVVVCQLPTASLSVNLAEVTVGDTVTLTWSTSGSDQGGSRSLTGVSSPAVSGSANVVVNSSGPNTYTLTVVNCSGITQTAQVTVIAYPIPTIDSFISDPNPALQDSQATISWSTTNASSASISGIGSNLPVDGSQLIIPTVDQTGPGGYPGSPTFGNGYRDYILTACNPVNRCVTQTLRLFVTPQPPVASLTVTPTTINFGDTVTLTWSNIYTTSAAIDQGIGIITPASSGTRTFTVTGNPSDFLDNSDKIFTLTAEGYGGVDTNSYSIQVLIDSTPTAWLFTNKTAALPSTVYYASSNSTTPL